ncbi:helicase-related protein [Hymenobacter caeli]|uniref:SNF2 family DNA or RNA helicase n=1 Tax=Hymenobacter caeli TaxID=2735894 RepID=A0ABX2FM24_9BACT|nr:helicase-related protein [Hymenobacter caeli]NRT17540.1 SNF2 family DNA or RNA helicase [Hymenobacter caeli]
MSAPEAFADELHQKLLAEPARGQRMQLNTLLAHFGYRNRSTSLLRQLDELLFARGIRVRTRQHPDDWQWPTLAKTDVLIFELDHSPTAATTRHYKMQTVNEPAPSLALFNKYASQSTEVLLSVAYVDEHMSDHLQQLSRTYGFGVRVVSDYAFNGNIYTRGRIRAKIEAVGQFRTSTGPDGEGIMHTKLYVFRLRDQSVVVFSGSANLTANAWLHRNTESPLVIQSGVPDDPHLALMINAAENNWQQAQPYRNMENLQPGDLVTHPDLGQGEIFRLDGENARVVFGDAIQVVKLADLTRVVDPLTLLATGQGAALARVKARFLGSYLYAQNSLTGEFEDYRIRPVPHQLLALKKFVSSESDGNLLLADDVGLGKTIEAGLIIKDVVRRLGDKARVLILVPASLKAQWLLELREKFGLNFRVWKHDTIAGAEAFSNGSQGCNLLIASYFAAVVGDMEEAILRHMAAYDLVIVDECHRASNDAVQLWKLLRDMRRDAKIGRLLLLSATPHSGDRNKFINLLHLLDQNRFPTSDRALAHERISQPATLQEYVYRNDKLSVTDFKGRPLFRDVMALAEKVELSAPEVDFCEQVVAYIAKLYQAQQKAQGKLAVQIGFVSSIYRKMLASSWKNVLRSMRARLQYRMQQAASEAGDIPPVDAFYDDDDDTLRDEREERDIQKLIKQMSSAEYFKGEAEMLQHIVKAGAELERQKIDTKVDRLTQLVNLPEHRDSKFIIFTQFVKTLEVLRDALGGRDHTAEIQGAISIDDRQREVSKFRNKVRFMISTEAGGEGINLQFASKIINFDMPWNPSRIQQRIGRVWRYGQEQDVSVINFYVLNAISDQRVMQRLDEKVDEMVREYLVNVTFANVPSQLRDALVYDLKMRVLGAVQEEKGAEFENIISELNDKLREDRLQQALDRIQEALAMVTAENDYLTRSVGTEVRDLRTDLAGFYASPDIPYLRLFATTIAEAFEGGMLHNETQKTYTFDLPADKLREFGINSALYANRAFTFDQGRVADAKLGEQFEYFGFGNTFFNELIELCRKAQFGGQSGFASPLPIGFTGPHTQVLALLTAQVSTVLATGSSERAEQYPVCAFVTLPGGEPVLPEDLFRTEWQPGQPQPVPSLNTHPNMAQLLRHQQEKIKALRRREFSLSNISLDAALA